MGYAICFLAYGVEHIIEFNIVAKTLLKIDKNVKIFVGTDSPDSIDDGVYKIIKINDDFNFNLKRLVIESALNEYDTILFLDTDVLIYEKIDLSILDNINENKIYVAELVGLNDLRDVYGSLDYMENYLNILKTFNDELQLIHEGYFILKINNKEQKHMFIKTWEEIDLITRSEQKMAYNLLGAMEGLIIYISVIKSNIDIEIQNGKIKTLFNKIIHLGKPNNKLKKTII